jgi:hypothetical protein
MNKYISHFTPRIKEEFLFDFISSLGNVSKEQIIFRQKFSGNDYNDIISHPTINLRYKKNNNEDK